MDRLELEGDGIGLHLDAGHADDSTPVVVVFALDNLRTVRQVQVGLLLEADDVDRMLVWLHQWREEHPS